MSSCVYLCEGDVVWCERRKERPHYMANAHTTHKTHKHRREISKRIHTYTTHDKIQQRQQSKWVVSIPPKLAKHHSSVLLCDFRKGFHFLIQKTVYARYMDVYLLKIFTLYVLFFRNTKKKTSTQMRWTLCASSWPCIVSEKWKYIYFKCIRRRRRRRLNAVNVNFVST